MQPFTFIPFCHILNRRSDPSKRTYKPSCHKYPKGQYDQKDYDQNCTALRAQHTSPIQDRVHRNTGQHHSCHCFFFRNDRCGYLDVPVLFVIVARALALPETTDHIFRYHRLSFIQTIRILDHIQVLVDDHHASVINIGQLG